MRTKFCPYIDIPLQHCNGDVLRAMNRYGNYDSLRELISNMRRRIPGLALRTTFMVGFPGETQAQFEELCRFVKEMEFDKMGCFAYSPEEDTPAAEFPNQVPEEEKTARADALMDVQFDVTAAVNQRRVGETYTAVIDGRTVRRTPMPDGAILTRRRSTATFGSIPLCRWRPAALCRCV